MLTIKQRTIVYILRIEVFDVKIRLTCTSKRTASHACHRLSALLHGQPTGQLAGCKKSSITKKKFSMEDEE